MMRPGDVVTPQTAALSPEQRGDVWRGFLADLQAAWAEAEEHAPPAGVLLRTPNRALRHAIARICALEAQRDELLHTALTMLEPWDRVAGLAPSWVAELRRGIARATGAGDHAAGEVPISRIETEARASAPPDRAGDYASREAWALPPVELSPYDDERDPSWCGACKRGLIRGDRVARHDGRDVRCERCAGGDQVAPPPSKPKPKHATRPHAQPGKRPPPAERVTAPPRSAVENVLGPLFGVGRRGGEK